MSYRTVGSDSSDEGSASSDNAYCIFLHIAEGVGLQRTRMTANNNGQHDQIMMHAALNTVKFEIEGHSTESAIIFNSNCIWECDLRDLKRMKSENRPVRIDCFLNNGVKTSPPLKHIGTLLLPMRGILTVSTLNNYQPKMLWHKLSGVATEWRSYKPEIYLLIVVAKKSLVDEHFCALLGKKPPHLRSPCSTETASMLHSQSNVYVQLLEQVGLIQVGNNPDVDCDIFQAVFTLRRMKDLKSLLESEGETSKIEETKFVFQYELFGSATQDEISTDASDNYPLNQKITLKFKTSLQSLKDYFQRIFYLPIIIYHNGHAVATYRFDCSKYLPDSNHYFDSNRDWNQNGIFVFNQLHKMLSPRAMKPSVEFSFSLQLIESYSRKVGVKAKIPLKSIFNVKLPLDEGASGDAKNGHQTARRSTTSKSSQPPCKKFNRMKSEPMMKYPPGKTGTTESHNHVRIIETKTLGVGTDDRVEDDKNETLDVCVGTEDLSECKTVAINTESAATGSTTDDTETVTEKMVKELEAWKIQQMDVFVTKLERKEVIYLRNLEKDWQRQHGTLQHCLDAKNAECEQLKIQLDIMKSESDARKLEDIKAATFDSERNLTMRIQQLEMDIKQWKMELEKAQTANASDKQALEVQQQEKLRLRHENDSLKKNISHLEQKIIGLGKTHFSADQLKDMMTDLREQTERFTDVERQRNFYKEKLSRATRELNQLKLGKLKQQELTLLHKSIAKGSPTESKATSKATVKEMIFRYGGSSSRTSVDDSKSSKK